MANLLVPKIENVESNEKYGRFVAEPLEKGFGTTLGNALRRVLLRYLPGAAVTKVRIEGIQHEFSPIPNVKEDVLDFVLNLKSLKIKPVTGQAGKLYLEKEGEGEIHASDITPSMDFEIVNPDLYLATLSGKTRAFQWKWMLNWVWVIRWLVAAKSSNRDYTGRCYFLHRSGKLILPPSPCIWDGKQARKSSP